MEEQIVKPRHTPPANHPWRKACTSAAKRWAYEESYIRDVNSVNSARPSTLSRNRKIVKKRADSGEERQCQSRLTAYSLKM